jgi:hypothetical protein
MARPSDEGVYSARIDDGLTIETSSSSVVKVEPDTDPPTLLSGWSYDGRKAVVSFSELVDAASATNAANYQISGTAVTSVALEADGKSVVLNLTARPRGPLVVRVSNVKDLAQNPIAAGAIISAVPLDLSLHDFATYQPYSASYDGNVAVFVGGGADIWGTSDSFLYAWMRVTNDFDYRMRVRSVTDTDESGFARAGLMVRDSVDAKGGREMTVAVNAGNSVQVLKRSEVSHDTESYPPNPLPSAYGSNSWVRLQRAGQEFRSYSSSNGMDWVLLSRFNAATDFSPPLSSALFFGVAVCGHSASATTSALVSDLTSVPVSPRGGSPSAGTVSAGSGGSLDNVEFRVCRSLSLALLEYRRNEFARASVRAQRYIAYPGNNDPRIAAARLILAMACSRLHQTVEAKAQLAEGSKLVSARFKAGLEPGNAEQGFWFDWAFAQALLREAEGVIDSVQVPKLQDAR